MPVSLADSYQFCTQVARTQAKNFYYSFLCLPDAKRAAMCAVYAWMRHSDDISDDGGEARADRMLRWRQAFDHALGGDYGDSAVMPALHDAIRRYSIPPRYFHELIDGTEMDLEPARYETFQDTYRYCYHVASVVGLVCIHVFEFEDPAAIQLAEWNGIAFQLTNILRDLREDAGLGRIYLPREDLVRFGYSESELVGGVQNSAFRALMEFEVTRARDYYDRAAPLVGLIHGDSRPCLKAMRAIYGGILESIVRKEYRVFSSRARVPTWKKLWIAGSALVEARGAQGGLH